jgi:peptide/nickel transport system permease protein
MDLGGIILTESTMSFLGIGVAAPYASWGNMVSSVNDAAVMQNYLNIWVPPGLCILITVLAFNFVGDGLRDAFDPKMKR